MQLLVIARWVDPQSSDITFFRVEQVPLLVIRMTLLDPCIKVVLILAQKLTKCFSGFDKLLLLSLHDSNSCLEVEVLARVEVLDILQGSVGSFVEVVGSEELNQLEEHLVTVLWLHVFILC